MKRGIYMKNYVVVIDMYKLIRMFLWHKESFLSSSIVKIKAANRNEANSIAEKISSERSNKDYIIRVSELVEL